MKGLSFTLCLLTIACYCGHAQEASADSSGVTRRGPITIKANVDSALVYIDSRYAGYTPLVIDTLSPGTHFLRILHPDISNWLTGSVTDSIYVTPGNSMVRCYTLDRWYSVISDPPGARVYLRDSLAGTTPLVFIPRQLPADSLLRIEKPGYDTMSLSLKSSVRGILDVSLKLAQQTTANRVDAVLMDYAPDRKNTLRLYLAGAATVLSGATAAYFKIKADGRHDAYLNTNDPALLSETRRLDTGAAIFLAITQVSLTFLAYFLLSE